MILCRALSYEENTLDKSLLSGISWRGMHGSTASPIPAFMWMMAIPEAASTAPASSR